MTTGLLWNNVVNYSLQIGLLVALSAFVPAVLRLRMPGARLAYWHLLLAACLLLPLVRPWRQEVVTDNTSVTSTVVAIGTPGTPAPRTIPRTQLALGLLVLGAAARLAWLALGFRKLRRYRRESRPFPVSAPWSSRAEFRIAGQIASPVTFGARHPVVLLPASFPALDERQQTAILCHELLHVDRHDWLYTVGEELVRAVLWFHPAIWWLLGEIQLAREQAVDRQVVEMTQARDEYVDALLAIAGAHPQPDLVPAPLFLRRRHLKQRVVSILKEVRMSRTRLVSALAAGLCMLLAACWFVTGTFPLAAAPQTVTDAVGISVDVGGAFLLHRAPVLYPETARTRGVQGSVVVEVRLDSRGNVADAHVLSGPDDLRNAALQSVLQWHFAHEAAGSTRQVTIGFKLAEATPTSAVSVQPDSLQQQPDGTLTSAKRLPPPFPPSAPGAAPQRNLTLKSIVVIGLPDDARAELLSKLPVHEGDTIEPGQIARIAQAAREVDEHLTIRVNPAGAGEAILTVMAPPNPAVTPVRNAAGEIMQIKIGGNVQSTKLISQPRPIYPPDAKAARVQGVVKLTAIIGADGTVKHLDVISGESLLAVAALDAVKQWVYQPTLLNGNPVEVQTQIDVNFTLSQ